MLKFGGAALADSVGIRRACELVQRNGGAAPIVVVSAALGVTELLEGLWREAASGARREDPDPARLVRIRHRTLQSELGLDAEFLDRHLRELAWILAALGERETPSPADRDHVLSFGERMSARVVAACLSRRGLAATPVDAFDLGLVSDSNHGRARPLPETARRVQRALAGVPGIPVVTGFVAVDAAGRLTTLGRNGSDLSASLIGAAVGASEVQFWKSVGGILTADPALVPAARPIPHLDYARAAEFARYGARVLHPDALEPLRAAGIPARVLCFAETCAGDTRIDGDGRGAQAAGLAAERGWAEVRGAAADARPPGALSCPGGFLAPWNDKFAGALSGGASVEVQPGWARIAALWTADESPRGAEVLARAGIEVRAARLDGRSTELLVVRERDLEAAARSLHEEMIESAPTRPAARAATA